MTAIIPGRPANFEIGAGTGKRVNGRLPDSSRQSGCFWVWSLNGLRSTVLVEFGLRNKKRAND
jgi:hypothetical protein